MRGVAQHRRAGARHKHRTIATLVALGLVTLTISVGSSPSTAAAALPPGFASELVAGGLDKVSDLYRLPDGWLVAEQCGRVRKIQGATLLPTPVIDLRSTTNCTGDRGLLGVAANSTHLFVFRALENGRTGASGTKVAVLSRFVLNGAVADPSSETDLLGGAGRPVAACGQLPVTADCIPIDGAAHSAAEIVILPDGSLVTGHGDGAQAALVDQRALRAQNSNSLGGKVYHLTTSGDGVSTNPRYNPASPRSNVSRIMAEGVRNPYRFDVRPDGIMFGDVGWNDWEELDWLPFGGGLRNFGWPCFEGGEQQAGYAPLSVCQQLYADVASGAEVVTPPVHAYTHTVDGQDIDSGVTGGVFYTGTSFPSAYNGAYFFTDFTRGQWYTAQIDATGSVVGEPTLFASDDYGAVDMEMGTDGSIYYARYPGEVRRMRFTGGTSITPVAAANATPASGQAPLAVQFSSAGSTDPDGGPLTMLWEFGDGGTSTLPNPVYMYLANGTFTARLTVKDDEGATATATVSITVGNRAPVPVITTPLATRTFSIGNSIYFEGRATDPEDGTGARVRILLADQPAPLLGRRDVPPSQPDLTQRCTERIIRRRGPRGHLGVRDHPDGHRRPRALGQHLGPHQTEDDAADDSDGSSGHRCRARQLDGHDAAHGERGPGVPALGVHADAAGGAGLRRLVLRRAHPNVEPLYVQARVGDDRVDQPSNEDGFLTALG